MGVLARWMERWTRWILRHSGAVLIVLGILTIGFAACISLLDIDVDFTNYLNPNDPAVVAADEAKDRYGSQMMLMVVVETEDTIFDREMLLLLERLGNDLEQLDVVREMDGPLNAQAIRGTETSLTIGAVAPGGVAPETEDEIAAYQSSLAGDARLNGFVVSERGDAAAFYLRPPTGTEMIPFAERVEGVVFSYTQDHPGIVFSVAGTPHMNLTLGRSMRRDLRVFIPLIVAAIVLVLGLSFRWLWGILVPFAVVAIANLWMIGWMALSGVPLTVISFILPVVIMAIGIADGIHVISRYREELSSGAEKDQAIVNTMVTMARPVVMTSLTTSAGFLSLLNAYLTPQRYFGVFAAAGVVAAMVLSLVLIPALLHRVHPPRRVSRRDKGASIHVLSGLAHWVRTHRRWVLAGSVLLVGAFAATLPLLEIETSQRAYLGQRHPAVRNLDVVSEHFAGADHLAIEIDTGTRDGLKSPEVLHAMADLQAFLEAREVRVVSSLLDIVREMNQRFHADDPAYYVVPEDRALVAQLLLLFTFQGGDLGTMALGDFSAGIVTGYATLATGEARKQLVDDLGAFLEDRFTALGAAEMVGATRIQASMFDSIARSQIASLFTSVGAAGLIMVILMRSLASGVIAMVPLLLTVLISFGVMACTGTPLDIATLMVSSITIGIGVDYGIHFIERFREDRRRGASRKTALFAAGTTTGRAIVSNAASLALGFAVLVFSSFIGMRHFGLLVMMAMVISAASALIVIPAILFRRDGDEGKGIREN